MTPSTSARGMAFLGLLEQLRGRFGASTVEAALQRWGPAVATATATRIAKTEWYPYAALVELLVGAETEFGAGDGSLVRELGEGAAKRDLGGGTFSVLRMLASPRHLISSCERVWPRYYLNAGKMIAVRTEPSSTVLRIEGFPAMAPMHCRMMEGWMTSAMAQIGATVLPGGRETACMSEGAPHHEFSCTWTT